MALPKPPTELERVKVEVFGEEIEVRALTRAEALTLKGEGPLDLADMEAKLIAYGTDTPLDEVEAWLAQVPATATEELVKAISEVSGLVVNGPFQPA